MANGAMHVRLSAIDGALETLDALAAEAPKYGLTDMELEMLPSRQPTGMDEDACAICLEPLSCGHGDVTILACVHCFHHACARRWLKSSTACPLCKAHALGELDATTSTRAPDPTPAVAEAEEGVAVEPAAGIDRELDTARQILRHWDGVRRAANTLTAAATSAEVSKVDESEVYARQRLLARLSASADNTTFASRQARPPLRRGRPSGTAAARPLLVAPRTLEEARREAVARARHLRESNHSLADPSRRPAVVASRRNSRPPSAAPA